METIISSETKPLNIEKIIGKFSCSHCRITIPPMKLVYYSSNEDPKFTVVCKCPRGECIMGDWDFEFSGKEYPTLYKNIDNYITNVLTASPKAREYLDVSFNRKPKKSD